jgi:hypothetical protein
MDESFICECGNEKFWYFIEFVRCPKCYNEYVYKKGKKELWLRRYNHINKSYNRNMEKVAPSFT